MSLPGDHDLVLYQGDSDKLHFSFLEDDANKTPVNLTGSVVTLDAKWSRKDQDSAIHLTAGFSNPEQGEFYFDIHPAHTKSLGASDKPLVLVYDIQYSHQATIITIVKGSLTVLPEVSP